MSIKVTPIAKAASMMNMTPTPPSQRPVVKMKTNTRSAGQQWVAKHAPVPTPQGNQPLTPPGTAIPPQPVAPIAAAQAAQAAPVPTATAEAQPSTAVGTSTAATEATNPALSPQYAALARREKALRNARKEWEAEKAAWEQTKATYIPKNQLETDPLKTLSDAGITYDKLTELQLNQVNPDPNQALLDKIAALEGRLAQVDEQFTRRDNDAYQQALSTIRRDADVLVTSDPAYETIRETGSNQLVVELIEKTFQRDGEILDVEEAARLVEDALVQQKLDEYQRLTKLAKFKQKLAPTQSAQPAAATPATSNSPGVSQTLTNSQATARPLTPVERAVAKMEEALRNRR